MSDTIALTGLVATDPRHIVTSEGLPITTFRLASTQRRFDRSKEQWVDGDTNWYTITAFRQLAMNSAGSLKKGERVLLTGRLRIREWQSGERNGMNIDVEADALGHDLSWGTTSFARTISSTASSSVGSTDASTENSPAGDTQPHEEAEAAVDDTTPAPTDELLENAVEGEDSRPMATMPF